MLSFYTVTQKGVNSRLACFSWPMLLGLAGTLLIQSLAAANPPAANAALDHHATGFTFQVYIAVHQRVSAQHAATEMATSQRGPDASGQKPVQAASARHYQFLTASRWSSFAYPDGQMRFRMIVGNVKPARNVFGGELLWMYRSWQRASVTSATSSHIIQRERIASTRIPGSGAVAVNVLLHTHQPGRYFLVWRHGLHRRTIAHVSCIYLPRGIHTPAAQSHWISPMPNFAPGMPAAHFAWQVANLVVHSGIKRYWLTLTSGDPVNRRQQWFSSALRAGGGQMLLRVIYPMTQADASQLQYVATSRWLKTAIRRLSAVTAIEPIFLVRPQEVHKYLPLMEKIFASDAAISQFHHASIILPIRWFATFKTKFQGLAGGVVIHESTAATRQRTLARLGKVSLPVWALPALRCQLKSNGPAARLLGAYASVVGVVAPWKNQNSGWLIHALGGAVWLQSQPIPHWGMASLFQTANSSAAVVSRVRHYKVRWMQRRHPLWLPNRVVSADIFRDMRLRRYDDGSYAQFTDPDASISVYDLRGQLRPALYPGLPRIPAVDSEALLISRESAPSLLAALRTASVHLEPRIELVQFVDHDTQPPSITHGSAAKQEAGVRQVQHHHPQRMLISLQTRSAHPQNVQLAAIVHGDQYKLIEPEKILYGPGGRSMHIYLDVPSHCLEVILALRGARRTWLARLSTSGASPSRP